MKQLTLLRNDEGYRKHIYKCSEGYNTIGIGLNLDAGISEDLAEWILLFQYNEAKDQCQRTFKWFRGLDEVRQYVIVNMVFNMGLSRFKKFKKTIGYIATGQYDNASVEMLDSRWARQVKGRSTRLSQMMKTGVFAVK